MDTKDASRLFCRPPRRRCAIKCCLYINTRVIAIKILSEFLGLRHYPEDFIKFCSLQPALAKFLNSHILSGECTDIESDRDNSIGVGKKALAGTVVPWEPLGIGRKILFL